MSAADDAQAPGSPGEIPTPQKGSNGAATATKPETIEIQSVHSCEMCQRTFINKKDFLLHQYHHKEKSSFYCAFCFKNFTSEHAFKKHNKVHEKKKAKMIRCKICAQEFVYVKDLEEHHRSFHLDEKKFTCDKCEATFSWRENLNKHMRMHATPTISHKCEHCGKKFMDNTSLRLHTCVKKTASEIKKESEKPFVCKLCDKAFQFDFSFRAHMNSHEGPVAISAWKNMQVQKMQQKSQRAKIAAAKQLQTVNKTEKTSPPPGLPTTQPEEPKPEPIVTKPEPFSSPEKQENLKEIVLEIVNVNELPASQPAGREILAEGPEENLQPNANTTGLVARVDLNAPVETPATTEHTRFIAPLPDSRSVAQVLENTDIEVVSAESEALRRQQQEEGEEEQKVDTEDQTGAPISVTTNLFAGVADETKSTTKKKCKRPLLYEYVMTEEKPFSCPECNKEFRWEISLNIHLQDHMGMYVTKPARNKKMTARKAGVVTATGHQSSKIVTRRASSDEEEDLDGDFTYVHQPVKRKRGRPRKNPLQPPTPKRKRGRPPKVTQYHPDPLIQQLERTNETVVIRVSRGNAAVAGPASQPTLPPVTISIPRHQLIRFYLLRQLKLSRYRGFYPCRFCSKPFSCKASLNMHILRHTGKGAYLCVHCGQKFPDHRTLVLHRLIEEEEEETTGPYQCNTCCRVCSSAEGLTRHIHRHLAKAWPSSRPRIKHTV